QVNSWLSTVFGDQPVPHFEVNTRTVDILYQLAQSSEARCSDTALHVEDLKQKASEYQAEGAHLQEVLLQGVGLSCASLSKPASDYLSALVDTAMVLGVRDTSLGRYADELYYKLSVTFFSQYLSDRHILSSFMPAVNNLTNQLLEAEKSNRRIERELRAVRKRLGSTLVLRSNLQEDINKTVKSQAVESAKAEERLLNMDFVTAKAKELDNRRQRAEAQLESRNMDKSITHQAIVQLSEEVTTAETRSNPSEKETGALHGLKPDYLSRIITSHSAHACDGQPLRLHCPRHSTISIQSAFYGSSEARLCGADPALRAHNHSCSAFTALQKLLSECQSHRDCQLPVNHLLFGKDPCPGTTKYLHVHYKCKPTEHKKHVVCEGGTMILHCKPPRVLNIYAAVYGRSLGETDTCPSHLTRPPPFECLNHEAVHLVSKSCYSKQKCVVAVSNQTFKDPCFPGTRKYLSVVYSCVPQTLLREADPNIFRSTSSPAVDTENSKHITLQLQLFCSILSHNYITLVFTTGPPADLEGPSSKGSKRPDNSGAMMSNSLLTYAYIKEHPETAALLFTSSVCIGLLLTLLAVSVRVTCGGGRLRDHRVAPESRSQTANSQEDEDDEDEEEEEDDDDDDETESSLISAVERKAIHGWEEVTYVSEAAERAERIERREMIIQEIWMNAYLNGSSC
ncbi:Protein eva-1-like protein C, partial [Nibea albiflora]